MAEIGDWVAAGGISDFMTLSGSGEPTLHARFGDVLAGIRQLSATRTALLTNSSLLHIPEVRVQAAGADVVKASLSAWDQATFEAVNRPHPELRFDTMVDGLRAFRRGFAGELWLEVMAVAGINDGEGGMRKIAELAASIGPQRVHLNTVARPAAEQDACPVPRDRLRQLARCFTPPAEVVGAFSGSGGSSRNAGEHEVMALLRRRPCTAADIAGGLGLPPAEAARMLERLQAQGKVGLSREGETVYHAAR
jgi:wyosine [tRNA(Phe)-imidazoG37] synthetase (radical SAM superfamily)